MGDKYGRQVGDTCKLMRPKAPKCEAQVGDKCKLMRPRPTEWETSAGDKWETSVNSCGPRHPE